MTRAHPYGMERKPTISGDLVDAALDTDLRTMRMLVNACKSFDSTEEDFAILLKQSAQDVDIFRSVVAKTNFTPLSDEKKAEYLASIINSANHEPSPQREAARILIDEVGFNPNNKANAGSSNALSAAAEQGDVETVKMVLNCRNRIRSFEDDAVRDLIIFGIDHGLVDVRRDLATPRGGEDAVAKLLSNETRMNELRTAKAEADATISEIGGIGGGGGRGEGYDELIASPSAKVSPEDITPAKKGDGCCTIS